MSGSELGACPPMAVGCFRKFSQVLAFEVCQVTQSEMSLVTLPSQVNLVPSKVAPLSSSGLMPGGAREGAEGGAVLRRQPSR